jgi:hypothetical protein
MLVLIQQGKTGELSNCLHTHYLRSCISDDDGVALF